ncbi:hypothetical protein [Lacrimispora sp.]|uniref:hypothetical protein n=1 Tax=Lacrimispora sp. TaxID=2719234 RepID=UPI0034606736
MYDAEYVLSSFEQYFGDKKDKRIVLYGIGSNTKLILDNFKKHHFIGIWNNGGIGDKIFDKEILSCEKALELGVEVVVIIARYQNVPIIFKRIAEFCSNNFIPVYTVDGKQQKIIPDHSRSFEKYKDISYINLCKRIEAADIVSFDVFDTILMRRILYPEDIFELVERRANVPGFAEKRKNIAQQLYLKGLNPNIYEIYENLKNNLSLKEEILPRLLNLEIEAEKEHLLLRRRVFESLQYASSVGKKVFLVSDMYLTREIIEDIFSHLGIELSVDDILISCEQGCSKVSGLFSVLKEKAGGGKILHIGDSFDWDYEYALKYGIDEAFHIESGLMMMLDSYAFDVLKFDTVLDNRLVLGEFISQKLNDPFLFSVTNGFFDINEEADIGYSYFAPFFYKWIHWVEKKIKEYKFDRILFGSRDGYLLLKICEILQIDLVNKSSYFYTSRIVAVLAMIQSEEDILYFSHMPFAGSIEEMIQFRFKLKKKEVLKRKKGESDDEYILRHKKQIFFSAERARERYLKYIEKLGISQHEKIAFIDFVAGGTSQMAVDRISNWSVTGLYFCRIMEKYKQGIKVESLYREEFASGSTPYNFFKASWLLENVLSSMEPSLIDFDEEGEMVFDQESRTAPVLEMFKKIQQGILNYQDVYKRIDFGNVDEHLTDALVGLMEKRYTIRSDEFFDGIFSYSDTFYNMQLDLSDF